jgi:hypothetical protein
MLPEKSYSVSAMTSALSFLQLLLLLCVFVAVVDAINCPQDKYPVPLEFEGDDARVLDWLFSRKAPHTYSRQDVVSSYSDQVLALGENGANGASIFGKKFGSKDGTEHATVHNSMRGCYDYPSLSQ